MKSASKMLLEADKLKKQIDAGMFKGAKLKSAKYRYYSLRYRAKKKVTGAKAKRSSPKPAAHKVSKEQGFLPNFLKNLDMVRVEELVAQKFFEEIKREIRTTEQKKKAS